MAHLGFDINTRHIAMAAVGEGEVLGWDLYYLEEDPDGPEAWNEIAQQAAKWASTFEVESSNVEVIPGARSGQRGAQQINSLATAIQMGVNLVFVDAEFRSVINRSWMSKTVGLSGRKNPSKDAIMGWCHFHYPDLEPIPLLWEKTLKSGKNKGKVQYTISDVYDALGIATYGELCST